MISSNDLIIRGDITDSLLLHTALTAQNTKPDIIFNRSWEYRLLWIFSFIAAFLAVPTAIFEWRTAGQTKQQRIKRKAQKGILRDLIRHLYRNKVVVCATRWKLETKGIDEYYPSEEHLLKLKMLPEDLRLDRFYDAPEHYGELHKLELLFRNYNIETDVALAHLKTKNMPSSVKTGDFETLEFKSQHLTKTIRDLMNGTKIDTIDDKGIRQILLKEVDDHKKIDKDSQNPADVPERTGVRYRYYDDDLHLTTQLNEDIAREYSVIKLIKF